MPKIDLGRVGAVVSPGDAGFVETAVELEALGFDTIWITGGPMQALSQIADVVRATRHVKVASAIIAVVRFPAADVANLYDELAAEHPGRFVVGLGGAHGPEPLKILNAYLDDLEAVPPTDRVLATLGPRMLDLARERAAGAFPVLVTPEYTARARATLGSDTTLAIEQLAVLSTDAGRARQVAREPLGFLGQMPAYQANFRRMGFSDDDIADRSDRLVDGLVVWGDVDAIAARVDEHRVAGADHVAVSLLTDDLADWQAVARRLVSR
jgi:probable F420-dependent oxidoreductase